MMSDFLVYGVPGSPYVRAVLLALEEKHADWTLIPLALGEHKSAEHLTRHPFGRMPVLEHHDFRLYETQAILRYLDRIVSDPPLKPRDAQAEARMNQIMGIADWYVAPDVTRDITFPRVVAPRFGLPVDENKIVDAQPRAAVCIDEIGRLLGDQPYMAGNALTLADLLLAPQLVLFEAAAEAAPMLERNPNISAWCRRMEDRPAMRNTSWEKLAEGAHAAA